MFGAVLPAMTIFIDTLQPQKSAEQM